MQMRIISPVKARERFILAAQEHYLKRITGSFKLAIEELRGDRLGDLPPDQIKKREGELILKAIAPRDRVVCLAETGRLHASPQFAAWLERQLTASSGALTFVVGGAYGFDEHVLDRCDERLSLSPLTFPHELARVILLEQIFRAATILEGRSYHK